MCPRGLTGEREGEGRHLLLKGIVYDMAEIKVVLSNIKGVSLVSRIIDN